MDQKRLSGWMKLIILGCALCGAVLFLYFLPVWLLGMDGGANAWPWVVCMWVAAIPCYGVLACGWRIAREIGADNSFSAVNARLLKIVSMLSAGDACFLLLASVALCLLNRPTPWVLPVISAFVCFVGLAISVAAACLSHLVLKAAKLQEDSDLTI